jgi:ferritin-like metal-binding protein YciE
MKDAAALLDRTLQEEKETDALLSRLAGPVAEVVGIGLA